MKYNIHWPHDLIIPLLDIYSRTWKHKDLYINIYISLIKNCKKKAKNKNWKQPKCPSTSDQISKTLLFPNNGILLSNKKERMYQCGWISKYCRNKIYILDDPITDNSLKYKLIYRGKKWLPGVGGTTRISRKLLGWWYILCLNYWNDAICIHIFQNCSKYTYLNGRNM